VLLKQLWRRPLRLSVDLLGQEAVEAVAVLGLSEIEGGRKRFKNPPMSRWSPRFQINRHFDLDKSSLVPWISLYEQFGEIYTRIYISREPV
jgi:hypothetical protein